MLKKLTEKQKVNKIWKQLLKLYPNLDFEFNNESDDDGCIFLISGDNLGHTIKCFFSPKTENDLEEIKQCIIQYRIAQRSIMAFVWLSDLNTTEIEQIRDQYNEQIWGKNWKNILKQRIQEATKQFIFTSTNRLT